MTRARDLSNDEANGGGATPPFTAGKNKVLNSNFGIWQRGTSVATGTTFTYSADRWQSYRGSLVAGLTVSRQSTSDTTNLPFIQYCARVQRDSGNTGTQSVVFYQSFESVNSIPFAGQTVAFSYYARAGANYSSASNVLSAQVVTGTGTDQNLGSAGYTGSTNAISLSSTLTTTWQRFTGTATFASNVTEIGINFFYTPSGTAGAADYFEITGVQLEAGNVATPFTTATGTIQGELAACQRYFYNIGGDSSYATLPSGYSNSTTQLQVPFAFPVQMRTTPSVSKTGNWQSFGPAGLATVTTVTSYLASAKVSGLEVNTASGITANVVATIRADNDITARINWSAEL